MTAINASDERITEPYDTNLKVLYLLSHKTR